MARFQSRASRAVLRCDHEVAIADRHGAGRQCSQRPHNEDPQRACRHKSVARGISWVVRSVALRPLAGIRSLSASGGTANQVRGSDALSRDTGCARVPWAGCHCSGRQQWWTCPKEFAPGEFRSASRSRLAQSAGSVTCAVASHGDPAADAVPWRDVVARYDGAPAQTARFCSEPPQSD